MGLLFLRSRSCSFFFLDGGVREEPASRGASATRRAMRATLYLAARLGIEARATTRRVVYAPTGRNVRWYKVLRGAALYREDSYHLADWLEILRVARHDCGAQGVAGFA